MFKKIAEGDIYFEGKDGLISVGSRTAVLPDGKLIATFNTESKIGINDFAPMVSYSQDGIVWSEAKYLWPQYIGKKSVYGSVRKTLDGRVCFAGVCTPITEPGQPYWSDEVGGMLENKLIFSISEDGYTFPDFTEVDLPYYGSAENPGGMLVDRDGTIRIIYAPYKAIEGKEDTEVCQLVMVTSYDGGKTFTPSVFAKDAAPCQYGESWLVRLSENCHMVSTWQTAITHGSDRYFLSWDGAKTFDGPYIMPFDGQSTALEVLEDGKVFVVYNYRSVDPAGVYLALAQPDKDGFHMLANEPVWTSQRKTYNGTSGEFNEWTDFAFGEPHVTVMPDGTLLVCLWYDEGDKKGIRFVKLSMDA